MQLFMQIPTVKGNFLDRFSALLSEEKLRKDLITKGLNRAREFSWRRTAEATLATYQNVIRFPTIKGIHSSSSI